MTLERGETKRTKLSQDREGCDTENERDLGHCRDMNGTMEREERDIIKGESGTLQREGWDTAMQDGWDTAKRGLGHSKKGEMMGHCREERLDNAERGGTVQGEAGGTSCRGRDVGHCG